MRPLLATCALAALTGNAGQSLVPLQDAGKQLAEAPEYKAALMVGVGVAV